MAAAPSRWISNRQLNSLTAIAKPIYQHAHGPRTVRHLDSKIKGAVHAGVLPKHTLWWLPSEQYAKNQSRATDRGRPNRAITPLSNAVIALTRPPAKVTTIRPNAWATRLRGLKT